MHFARAAYRAGMVSRARLARWGVEHVRFRLRGSTDERTAQVLSQVKELLAGVPERDIERMAPDLLAGVLPRIYPQMLEEVRAHQDAGRATFIVSAAGNGLVEMLARVLGMDGGIGTRYEVDAGRPADRAGSWSRSCTARARWPRCSASPTSTTSTSRSRGRTPTRPRTCRCCGRSATRSPSTPTPSWPKLAADEGWRVMRFEKLGRRLAIGGRHRGGGGGRRHWATMLARGAGTQPPRR